MRESPRGFVSLTVCLCESQGCVFEQEWILVKRAVQIAIVGAVQVPLEGKQRRVLLQGMIIE